MANIQSAIKRNRQNKKRHLRNRMVISRMRTYVKKAEAAIKAGDKETAEKAVQDAVSHIDRAAQKGVIHINNASRRKSRLMGQVSEL